MVRGVLRDAIRLLLSAALCVVGLCRPAQASAITYDLNPAVSFMGDTLTGTFTYNSSPSPTLLSVDITATGSTLPDVFSVAISASNSSCRDPISTFASGGMTIHCIVAEDATGSEGLILFFADTLSTTSDAVLKVEIGITGAHDFGTTSAGDAAPVPEPASLTLLGTALVGFGLFRRRRRA